MRAARLSCRQELHLRSRRDERGYLDYPMQRGQRTVTLSTSIATGTGRGLVFPSSWRARRAGAWKS
jgi:hypothetical protein